MRMSEQSDTHIILRELEATKKELKNSIEESENRILISLNNRIRKLEEENLRLKEDLETLEIKTRKNNIVLFGVDKNKIKEIPKLCQDLGNKLKISITGKDISDAYCLGNTDKDPIKLELTSYLKKSEILRNRKNLKGSGIYVATDLTRNQQAEQKF